MKNVLITGSVLSLLCASSTMAASGIIMSDDIISGALSYTTPDSLVTMTPKLDGAQAFFGGGLGSDCCWGVINDQLNDSDGDPNTTADQQSMEITFDATVGLTRFDTIWTRATTEWDLLGENQIGPLDDGIRISGFTSDPGLNYYDPEDPGNTLNNVWNVEQGSYDALTGTVNIDAGWDSGWVTAYHFTNPAASFGQTLIFTVADRDESNPQMNFFEVQYGDIALDLPVPPIPGDINGDGFVGIADLNIVLGNWNAGTPPETGTPSIPEPATFALFSLGATAILRRKTN
jgi:hypothetical protein